MMKSVFPSVVLSCVVLPLVASAQTPGSQTSGTQTVAAPSPVATQALPAAKPAVGPAVVHRSAPARSAETTSLAPQLSSMTPVPDFDSRLRLVDYDQGEVYRLTGCVGFQTTITLAATEHVDNVSLGDSSAWQVSVNKRGNLIFVKPTAGHAFSNMTVISDKRNYNFELRTAADADCNKGRVVYEMRFRYVPDVPTGTPTNPSKPAAPDPNAFLPSVDKRNSAYSYSGASELIPLRVFDDGLSTYFKWASDVSTPAVYALNSDNSESIVNYASRGDYLVIEQVARAYVLRRGTTKAILYNDSYRLQGLDADSPKPRTKGGK